MVTYTYLPTDISSIDNYNLQEHHLNTKNLHLNNESNSVFPKNILHSIES